MLMRVFLCVSILSFSSAFLDSKSSDDNVPCESGWYFFRDKCYRVGGRKDTETLSWARALSRCRNLGGDLVSIQSHEEQDFIVAFLLLDVKKKVWTGLNDLDKEQDFRWTDGSVYNYSKWNKNEPSTHGKKGIKGEDCVELLFYPGRNEIGLWNDLKCHYTLAYICEKNANPGRSSPNLMYCSPEEGGGWKYHSSCYHIVTDAKSWRDAERHCKNTYSGHLLTIRDMMEDYYLELAIPDIKKEMWIGIEMKNQLQQKWSSGWYVSYDGFNKEKKTFTEGTCIARRKRKEWVITPCSRTLPFICEVTKESPPVLKEPPAGAHCPKDSYDWRDFGGEYCYYINTKENVTYFEAHFDCNRRGGDLVSLHSQEETDILLPFIRNTKEILYIGLIRLYANYEEAFGWIDGSKLDYQNWAPGEPNREEEKCVAVTTTTMNWLDYHCDNPVRTTGHICSVKKIVPVSSLSTCKSFCVDSSTYLFGILSQCPEAKLIP